MPPLESLKRWTIFVGTWLLGILFIGAAFLKALDLNSFEKQIERYQLLSPNLVLPFAIALIVLEGAVGLACLVSFRPRIALWAMIALLTLFLTTTLFSWNLLQDTSCNCFGPVVAGGPRGVVLHTTAFIALAAGLLALMRKTIARASFRGWRTVSGVVAMFLLMFAAFPKDSTLSQDTRGEDQIRIFLSATCEKCKKDVDKVRDLANSTELPPVRVFIGASYEYEIDDYFREGKLQVNYTPLTYSQLSRETPSVPKVQVFRAGNLVREWQGDVPGLDEVKGALSIAPQEVNSPQAVSTKAPTGD